MSDERIEGTVRWFNARKGYGFIDRDDGQGSVFVHYSDIEAEGYKSLEEGEHVSFEVIESDKGPKAVRVRRM
ncbi:MAG: cold shock domain-containing protein [candidate division WOR-3 bacterium]|jgi:CspA family cold shock protein